MTSTWLPAPIAQGQGKPEPLSRVEVEAVFRERLAPGHRAEAPKLARHLTRLAKAHRFPPSLLLALIDTESSFRPRARSHAGALGLMQVMPATAGVLRAKHGMEIYRKPSDLFNPVVNLELGVRYLALMRERYSDLRHSLAAYNLGPGNVDRHLKTDPSRLKRIKWYVDRILTRHEAILRGARAVRTASSAG